MKNRLIKITILSIELILFYFIFVQKVHIGCFFRDYLGFKCVACGLSRAFVAIFHLSFLEACKYNIISIPLFIFLIILNGYFLYDIILDTNKTQNLLKRISKYYIIILVITILTTIVNNI